MISLRPSIPNTFPTPAWWRPVALLAALLLPLAAVQPVAAAPGTVVAWGDDYVGETNVPAGLSGVTA